MTYEVYFEIYGKRMKTTIEADSESKARDIIRYKIRFHKVEEKVEVDSELQKLGELLGIKF